MDWTPSPRRSSAMRREQNLAIIGAVVTGAVVAVGLILLLFARVNPTAGQSVREAALDLVTPIWGVVRAPFDGIGRAVDAGGNYLGAVSRADALETELAKAKAELQSADADRIALRQIKRLLMTAEPRRQLVATARIVSAAPGMASRTALVSAGRRQGVLPGMPVIGADGLIGRTVEAGENAARLLLLTDAASRIPVLIMRTGQAALLSGDGSPSMVLTDRLGPEEPLQPGDRLVSSGEGGVFPPGIPVGMIAELGAQQSDGSSTVGRGGPVRVRLAATPVGAGFVRIERPFAPLPGEVLVPMTDAPVPVEAQRGGGIKGAAVRGIDAQGSMGTGAP